MSHRPHFPITVLTYNATLIVAAAQKYPKVAARLADTYLADTTALIAKIPADVISQKNAQGETSQLTAAQQANFDLLVHYMNPAIIPANGPIRDEFRLNTFPPDNHTTPEPTPPTPPASPAK